MFTLGPAMAEDRVTVFAAASLREALDAVLEGSDSPVAVSYSGSGVAARQIAQGAPADIVILANVAWMDWLDQAGRLEPDTRSPLLGNRLVVVGPGQAAPLKSARLDDILARLDGGRMAVGHTDAVPAGIYAKEWMQSTGLWAGLRPHLAETENVRAALALAARGEVVLAVVYASDAMAEDFVDVVWNVDPETHSQIVYPMAVVAGRASASVSEVAALLRSEDAAEIFRAHGFLIPEAGQ